MFPVTIRQVRHNAREFRGDIDKIYIHWTAGSYEQAFEDYHFCIKGDGTIIQTTTDLSEVLAHTWHRNSRAIGVALCCAYDAQIWADGSFDLGTEPPTDIQIERCSKLVAVLATALDIPITPENIMTHAECADLDGYGPESIGTDDFEKWDLWKLQDFDGEWKNGGDVIRGKALWYQNN